MDNLAIDRLLNNLKDPDELTRQEATEELWRIWFHQKGVYGLEILSQSQEFINAGQIDEAEAILTDLLRDQPDFAEAWNRRAVLYYLQKQYRRSLTDCQRVVELNPVHFGALHGMGLCHAALGEYGAAIQAFRRALDIQPYALVNQRMILECTAKLS